MASVNVQEEVAAPAKKVWDLISDFGGIQKFADPRFITKCECNGDTPGSVRTITLADGEKIQERLETFEGQAYRFSYSILGECSIPVRDYLATTKVTAIDKNKCQIDWQSTFNAVGPAEEAEKIIRGVYTGGVIGIRKALGL